MLLTFKPQPQGGHGLFSPYSYLLEMIQKRTVVHKNDLKLQCAALKTGQHHHEEFTVSISYGELRQPHSNFLGNFGLLVALGIVLIQILCVPKDRRERRDKGLLPRLPAHSLFPTLISGTLAFL